MNTALPSQALAILQCPLNVDAAAASITYHRRNITCISVYARPHHGIRSEAWKKLFGGFPTNTIIGGDLNAYHPLWGVTASDSAGEHLVDYILSITQVVLKDGSHTFMGSDNKRSTAIDITFCMQDIASDSI